MDTRLAAPCKALVPMNGPGAPSAPLERLDGPVRRYLSHALPGGAPDGDGIRLTMEGRINVGRWLAFTADQTFAGHSFTWRARAGWRSFRPLHVVDTYGPGAGSTVGTLFGRLPFMRATGDDTARAAAGRAAAESIWTPWTLLPGPDVAWRAESDDHIVARVSIPPERPEIHLAIAPDGAVRTVSLMRWGNAGQKAFGYLPFGGHIHEERRFGDLVLPSRVSVGWWYGTPRYQPFFEATVLSAEA